jgi:hypothetical protein
MQIKLFIKQCQEKPRYIFGNNQQVVFQNACYSQNY